MILKGRDILQKKFNRLKLTMRDFRYLCRLNNVSVLSNSDTFTGYYYCCVGKHIIVLSSFIESQDELEKVAWHEFAHFLQNFYNREAITACKDGNDKESPREVLADVFGAIALDPKNVKLADPMQFIDMLMGIK